jgi:hypothetical protein
MEPAKLKQSPTIAETTKEPNYTWRVVFCQNDCLEAVVPPPIPRWPINEEETKRQV